MAHPETHHQGRRKMQRLEIQPSRICTVTKWVMASVTS